MSKIRRGLTDKARRELIGTFIGRNKKTAAVRDMQPSAARVPDALCDFEKFEEYQKLEISRMAAKKFGLENPYFHMHDGIAGATTRIGGKEFINFSSYNYLGLSGHPAVNRAAHEAIERYGTSAGASRLVAGERLVQRELEEELAKLYGVDDCVVFVSGHATNVTTIGCLFGPKDLIVHDALIHNSVLEGAKLSGATRRSFPHNNPEALDALLSSIRGKFARVLVVIEGHYSMDGDIPDLPRFIEVKNRHKAFLMVDEAHSLGVLGATAAGIREHFGVAGRDADIWMGTLSKALAGCGGFICGSRALVDHLKYAGPGFVYSVGISPLLAAASLAALRLMQAEPERAERLRARTKLFLEKLQAGGIDTGLSEGYAIVPVIVKSSTKAVRLSNALFGKNINVQPIIYPAVEEKAARLRFFVSSEHTQEQVEQTATVVVGEVKGK